MNIAVVGQPAAWSTERLADALRAAGATASVVDLAACSLRLPDRRLFHRGEPLEKLDGAVVKKLGDTAEGWGVQERIGMLRHLETSGVPVLSAPDRLHVAVNRYRMTCELVRGGLPVPETTITEDIDAAAAARNRRGAAQHTSASTRRQPGGRGPGLPIVGGDRNVAAEANDVVEI